MPGYQDHLLVGSVLVLVFASVAGPYLTFTPAAVLVSVAVILLASVFPDVDHRGSVVHRRVKAFTALLVAAIPATLAYPDLPRMLVSGGITGALTLAAIDQAKPRHRTVTHTFEAAIVFSAAAGAVSLLAFGTFLPALFAFVAYGSHLLLDRVL